MAYGLKQHCEKSLNECGFEGCGKSGTLKLLQCSRYDYILVLVALNSFGSYYVADAKQLFMQVPARLFLASVLLCFTYSATAIIRRNHGHCIRSLVSQRSFEEHVYRTRIMGWDLVPLFTLSVVYAGL